MINIPLYFEKALGKLYYLSKKRRRWVSFKASSIEAFHGGPNGLFVMRDGLGHHFQRLKEMRLHFLQKDLKSPRSLFHHRTFKGHSSLVVGHGKVFYLTKAFLGKSIKAFP